LIPKPFPPDLLVDGIQLDDEEGPKRLIDIGRAGPVDWRELGGRDMSIDCPRRENDGDGKPIIGEDRGEATMVN